MLKVQESLKLCSTRESDIIGGSYRVSLLVVLPSANEVAERKCFQKRVSRILSMAGCVWGHAWQGVCMAGWHAWQGACMAEVCMAGDMAGGCVAGGTCMAGECAWWGACVLGACMAGDMHGRGYGVGSMCGGSMHCGGHAWHGGVAGDMATAADGMHPTGMHSCAI